VEIPIVVSSVEERITGQVNVRQKTKKRLYGAVLSVLKSSRPTT
jgi:hypothetical protein